MSRPFYFFLIISLLTIFGPNSFAVGIEELVESKGEKTLRAKTLQNLFTKALQQIEPKGEVDNKKLRNAFLAVLAPSKPDTADTWEAVRLHACHEGLRRVAMQLTTSKDFPFDKQTWESILRDTITFGHREPKQFDNEIEGYQNVFLFIYQPLGAENTINITTYGLYASMLENYDWFLKRAELAEQAILQANFTKIMQSLTQILGDPKNKPKKKPSSAASSM